MYLFVVLFWCCILLKILYCVVNLKAKIVERRNKYEMILVLNIYLIIVILSPATCQIAFQSNEKLEVSHPKPSAPICKTPDGLQGLCVDLFLCDPILSLLRRKPLPSSIINHLRKSVCKRKRPAPDVCCPQNIGKKKS